MERIELVMSRDDLAQLPRCDLPPGFSFRGFRDGDQGTWAEIETGAGEFSSVSRALAHFQKEFAGKETELGERCFFVQTESGCAIGTAMAWYGDLLPGGIRGRLHWVGIRREHQGRGVGKPLVARALQLLAARHHSAYLTTQTSSFKAVKIYLDFGFKPYITAEAQRAGWSLVAQRLGRPDLELRSDP